MLPDVAAEDRCAAVVHERVVLIGRGADGELAIFHDEPGPAGAETGDASLGEGFFEGIEAAKGSRDGLTENTSRCAACVGAHDVPEQRVVEVTAAVVAHRATDGFRHAGDVFAEIFDGFTFEFGIASECVVQIGDVSVVMLAVMNLHRLLVDVRFEGVGRVRQGGEGVGHGRVGLKGSRVSIADMNRGK